MADSNGGMIGGLLVGRPFVVLTGAAGGFIGGFYAGLKVSRSRKGSTAASRQHDDVVRRP